MPRELSDDTEYVYWWLWHWPWASAADIARITGLKASAVSNALKRGETKLGWFVSARLGLLIIELGFVPLSPPGLHPGHHQPALR